MSLLDRLSGADPDNKLPVHQFFGSLVLYSNGTFGNPTSASAKQALKDEWGVTGGADLTEFDAMIASYTAAADKNKWLETIHSIFMLAEQDRFDMRTKATANSAMQDAE